MGCAVGGAAVRLELDDSPNPQAIGVLSDEASPKERRGGVNGGANQEPARERLAGRPVRQ